MSNYSLKIRILMVFIVSISIMALIFFTIVIRGANALGLSQMNTQAELIKNQNKQEVKNYLQIAQEAVKASYDKTKQENIVHKIKYDAIVFEEILTSMYETKKGTMDEKALRELLVHVIQGYRYN